MHFFLILFYLTLQYCIGFAIYQNESATGIHVFPILNRPPSSLPPYHPSGSSQCTSPKHPVWCIEPGLAIRFIYDIIHISMPLSQIILKVATGWLRQWRSHLKYRRTRFDPWVGKIPWRRKWLLIPVFLPGKSHEQRSLAGCSPWGPKELNTT